MSNLANCHNGFSKALPASQNRRAVPDTAALVLSEDYVPKHTRITTNSGRVYGNTKKGWLQVINERYLYLKCRSMKCVTE
ncbi:MAG: hypothetical protein FWE01_02655 [Firmicutes bacterium]|nr:hypothetical protein [Bacillota bacterium]